MPIIKVTKDEKYPFYEINGCWSDYELDVTEEELLKFNKGFEIFYEIQKILMEKCEVTEYEKR